MATGASLDELRRESERRYADYPITLADGKTVVTLRAPLRMASNERDELRGLQSRLTTMQDDEQYRDADLLDMLRDMIRLAADDDERGEALIGEIGDDLALLQTLFDAYTERTQTGEASSSVS